LALKTEESISVELLACWEHFERQPQHALYYCQIYAALVEGGAEEELYYLILGPSREA